MSRAQKKRTKNYNASKIDTYINILKIKTIYIIWFMSHKQ